MGHYSDTPIPFNQLGAHLRETARRLSKAQFEQELMPNAGRMMVNVIRMRFGIGSGPNRERWLSTARETKLGGRWSRPYKRSDGSLNAGSIRLFFTGALMRSYTAVIQGTRVIVGPRGQKFIDIATRALEKWGNIIAGWDDESKQMMDKEVAAFLKRALD
jgi:hypothetical protein